MPLILESAQANRKEGTWAPDDFDVVDDEETVGRIMLTEYAPKDAQWFWSIDFFHRGQRPNESCQGYATDRKTAMKAFREAWDADDRRAGTK